MTLPALRATEFVREGSTHLFRMLSRSLLSTTMRATHPALIVIVKREINLAL